MFDQFYMQPLSYSIRSNMCSYSIFKSNILFVGTRNQVDQLQLGFKLSPLLLWSNSAEHSEPRPLMGLRIHFHNRAIDPVSPTDATSLPRYSLWTTLWNLCVPCGITCAHWAFTSLTLKIIGMPSANSAVEYRWCCSNHSVIIKPLLD